MGWIKKSIKRLLLAVAITVGVVFLLPATRGGWPYLFSILLAALELRNWILSDELSLVQKGLLVLSLATVGVFLIYFFGERERVADQLTIFLGGGGAGVVLLALQRFYTKW